MASLNKIHHEYTHEEAKAKRIDSVEALERSVMSCMLWENEFYEDGVSIAQRIEELAAVVPIDELVRITLQSKQDMRLRHAPLFLACQVAKRKDGRQHVAGLLSSLITRPDDVQEFLAIYWHGKRRPIAKQVKRALGEAFRRFDEYTLAKYNGGAKAIKLRDVLRLTHPKPENQEQSELWKKLVKNELATPDTWEVELSKGGDKKESWERLIAEKKLGGLATLRNIRNMREAGVDDALITNAISGIHAGKLLPMNFVAAATHNPQFESQIEEKFFECFSQEKVSGKTVILVDVSGSMGRPLSARSQLQRIDVACALAMIAREMYADVNIMTFSSALVHVPARRGFALRDAILHSQPHSSTFLGEAIKGVSSKYEAVRLIVITDEQSHDPVPDVKGYMINVASAKNGVGYGQKWFHINGWSDKVLTYIQHHESNA